jgi:hypothetical protein
MLVGARFSAAVNQWRNPKGDMAFSGSRVFLCITVFSLLNFWCAFGAREGSPFLAPGVKYFTLPEYFATRYD